MSIVTSQEMFQKRMPAVMPSVRQCEQHGDHSGYHRGRKGVQCSGDPSGVSGARKYANRTYLVKLVEAAVIETGLPICLHLDHGDSFELCKSCVG